MASSSTSSSSSSPSVRLIMGTMTIGPALGNTHSDGSRNPFKCYCQTPPDIAEEQFRAFISASHARIQSGPEAGKILLDTASAYQNGYCEETIGTILSKNPELKKEFSFHTKANSNQLPWQSLSKESVIGQAEQSLKALQIDKIDIFYLHSPDINTDIESTLDGIQQLHTEGKIIEFGLSNYPAFKVVDIYYRCQKRSMVLPTVFQGCYNALTRSIEFELAATCREFNIRMYHYNPLMGGLLTGKYSGMDDQLKEAGRFGAGSPISGTAYSARYWKEQYFKALDIIKQACDKENITMGAASLRWLLHHSILNGSHYDGIILGASQLNHCIDNLKACNDGPLPSSIITAFDEGWKIARFVSFPYFRNYGSAPGLVDSFMKKYQSNVPNSVL